jgi:hypothetical protein
MRGVNAFFMLHVRCDRHCDHATRLAPEERDRLAWRQQQMSLQLTNTNGKKTMKTANRFWKTLVIPVALAAMTGIGLAAELNPAAVAYKLPDQIKWSEPDARGVQTAVVAGDPSKPGFYAVLTKWLKGNHFSRPHFHPNDRYITVLQGTWWVATGPKFDPAQTVPMSAGSFVTHFGKQVHWDGAKDEDAVLLIVGEGPGTSTAAEEK